MAIFFILKKLFQQLSGERKKKLKYRGKIPCSVPRALMYHTQPGLSKLWKMDNTWENLEFHDYSGIIWYLVENREQAAFNGTSQFRGSWTSPAVQASTLIIDIFHTVPFHWSISNHYKYISAIYMLFAYLSVFYI